MKSFVFVLFFVLSFKSFAHSQTPFLPMASNNILDVVDLFVEPEDVVAWKVSWADEERQNIVMDIKATVEGVDEIHSAGCHVHHDHLHCHYLGSRNKGGYIEERFEEMREVEDLIVDRVQNQFARFGGFEAVEEYKVWTELGDDHDHDHDHENKSGDHHSEGNDYWVKLGLVLNGSSRDIFFLCHRHGHGADFSCHIRNHGHGEPQF